MFCETVYLREENKNVRLEALVTESDGSLLQRDAVLILPGGAYYGHAPREGEPAAKQFIANGFNAFILYYSVGDGANGAKFPRPLVDVSLAIAHIKRNAEKYHINPDRIFVCGFSAGGHLAGSIGTFWNRDFAAFEGMQKGENRPRGVILSYPVVTMKEYAHDICKRLVCGSEAPDEETENLYSLELQVTEATVPHYIWQTATDDCVSVKNALLLANALADKKVPVELHIFPFGPHGMSVANGDIENGDPALNDPHIAKWVSLGIEWTKLI